MKGILILICTMLFLSAVASVQLLLNYFDTIREYRENLYRITLDSYVSLIEKNCENLSMAMEVTALDQGVRSNIFRSGVDEREMLGLGNDMRKIVESNTYLLCPGAEIYSHKFFTYLPGDGRNFFPLEDMEKESWYKDYIVSGKGYYQCFRYSDIAEAWQLVLVHTVNDFSTAYPTVYGEQRVCFEAVAVNVDSLIPKREEIFSNASARVFLVDKSTGGLVYRSTPELAEAALRYWAGDGASYGSVSGANGERYVGAMDEPEEMGTALVLLFDPVPAVAGAVKTEVRNVIFSVGLFVILTLVLFLFYLNYRRRIRKTIARMDTFDEASPQAEEVKSSGDEIDEMDRHVVSMQNRIRTLIEEEYTVKLQMISAQHEALIACINPHFLYNTLSSISAMASLERAEDTNEMIYALSDMFKYSADVSRKTVTLGEELQNIASYLHIQQVRYGDSFVWHSDVPEELLRCSVPKLMLQPVVENCFKHGFEARDKRADGVKNEIDICAVHDGGELKIYVTDNGRGMSGPRLAEIRESLSGASKSGEGGPPTEIGLRNVHRRLQLIYGAGCGIELSCEKNGYTCVKIILKYGNGSEV